MAASLLPDKEKTPRSLLRGRLGPNTVGILISFGQSHAITGGISVKNWLMRVMLFTPIVRPERFTQLSVARITNAKSRETGEPLLSRLVEATIKTR